MTLEVDPVWLNLGAPLTDAIVATVCAEWSHAADLWFEVTREPDRRLLASLCGAEAALNAGLLDMAEYFYLGFADLEEPPAFIALLRARNEPVRQARKTYYALRRRAHERQPSLEGGRELIRLHLYREAVRSLLLSSVFADHPEAAAPLLARAYAALGAHASLIALSDHVAGSLADPKVSEQVGRAERLMARRSDPPSKNLRRFVEQHAAGQAFAGEIAAWGRPPVEDEPHAG